MISISRPLKSNRLNQGFGANGSCIEPDTRKVITKTGLTCPIPYVDFYLFRSKKGKFIKGHQQLNSGKTHFKKGFTPWNKGTKGLVKPNSGSFKKGQVSPNKGKIIPAMSVAKMGENNPMWGLKGELSPFFKGGYKLRLFNAKMRKARKKSAEGSHTFGEWETLKAQYNWTCPACLKREPNIKLTEDHIVPLYFNGTNDIGNIQPLCGSCNSKKRTKNIKYDFIIQTS